MSKKGILLALAALVIGYFILIPLLNWEINRRVKYELDYKGQVQDTVKEMVKPECLSDKK